MSGKQSTLKEETMRLTHIALTCLCLVMSASLVAAKEKKPEKQVDMQAMMETYQKLATPGEPHKQLASMSGSWNTKTKSWMEPNKPPREETGACEQKMVMDGRFLHAECTGNMMGQPFTGIGVTGYDNHTKKYVSTWMDSMGTGIYFMEGTAGADGKTITQTGSYNDPIEGPMKLRAVTKLVDENTETFTMYGTGKRGKDMKMMEITYTRKP
ncbi:MAG: DUF1579 domain-containing protein [Nitrospiraceae bacterium]